MVLTGIQPPENMQKPGNSLSIGKSIRTPAVGGASRSHFIMGSNTPQHQNSANALSGAHKDSPQRSAGSFNIVHPMRRALMSSEHRSTSNIEVDNDENDVVICWGKPSTDIAVGTPSSPLLPCFINAYSWEDQPLFHIIPTSNSNIHLHSSELLEPKLLAGAVTSSGSDVTHISSAESVSTSSSGSTLSLTKQAHLKSGLQLSLNKENNYPQGENVSSSTMHNVHISYKEPDIQKMIKSTEEDDGLAYCLQEEFWAHHEVLCDSDTIFQDKEIIVDNMLIDIPTSASFSAVLKSDSMNSNAGQGSHSKSIMSNFPYVPSNLVGHGDDGMFGSCSSYREFKLCQPATVFINAEVEVDAPSLNPVNVQFFSDVGGGEHPDLMYSKGKHFTRHEADHEGMNIFNKESHLLAPPSVMKSTHMQSLAHPGSIMAEGTGMSSSIATLKTYYGGSIEGKSPLVRSCSLTNIPPTSCCLQVVEQSPPLIRASGLSNMELLQGKKRSFSASELNSAELSRCSINADNTNSNEGMKPQVIHKVQRRRHGTATDPQSIAARTRREKFSKKIRMLQSLVPNGERLDTVSMLGQTLEYIRFLQYQLGELYHGPDNTSPLTSSKCEKWKDFMDSHSATTSNTSSVTSTS